MVASADEVAAKALPRVSLQLCIPAAALSQRPVAVRQMRLLGLGLRAVVQHRATAVATVSALVGAGTALSESSTGNNTPLFRFGVIADIQYCDTDDAANFAGTEVCQ